MSKLKRGIAKVSTVLVGAVAVLAPGLVLAAVDSNTLGPDPTAGGILNPSTDPTVTGSSFAELAVRVINIFIWVIGVVAVFYLLLSGFNYITAGGDDEKATAARKGIINAIIGIIIVVAAFFILQAAASASNTITGNTV